MWTTITSILSGVLKLFNTLSEYIARKDMENSIKNSYEKDKEISALEEDKKTAELIEESNKKTNAAKETVKNISKAKKDDADLTDDEITKEIMSIVDPDERLARAEQIKQAKEIKKQANDKHKEIEADEKFNSGEEFSFKG